MKRNWKNGRPDGWNARELRERQVFLDPQGFSADREINMIEAGADAMYEALMEYRVKMPSDFKPILIVIPREILGENK